MDHYHFRMLQGQHPSSKPITLQQAGDKAKKWWAPYYDPKDTKYTERVLFAQGHHAAVAHGAVRNGLAMADGQNPMASGVRSFRGASPAPGDAPIWQHSLISILFPVRL